MLDMWTSIVRYLTDSSKITAIYAIISLLTIKESFDNQRVECQTNKDVVNFNANAFCTNRVLFNSSSGIPSLDEIYFSVPYVYGFHVAVVLGITSLSPHLLPISVYLLTAETEDYFKEWNKISIEKIYGIINHIRKR